MPTAPTFAALLRQHRLATGLTQEALAERAGLSVHGVQKLERGVTQPYRDTAQRLASALRLAPDERSHFLDTVRSLRRRQAAAAQQVPDAGSGNLPSPLTSFIGRDEELATVSGLLARARLVTLTGLGGCGKTRLALAVAAEVAHGHPDGVAFVDLASVRDERLVPATIAWSLGLTESGGRSARELLLGHLRDQQRLLVLDNFEHLLGAAPLVTELLQSCRRLTVLVTSRAALRLSAEHRVAVGPLATPGTGEQLSLAALVAYPAVRLFVERAQAVAPFRLEPTNAEAVAAICRRLDGLPLALELAAARAAVLPPAALLHRLERRLPLLVGGAPDLPPRQRALRATLAWSYDLLGPSEQTLFRRLSVFAGGCTLEAAEAVCTDAGLPAEAVLDRLQALVDASLVQRAEDADGEPRFSMLETIREYAAECLEATGEARALEQRHLGWYLGRAEASFPEQHDFGHVSRLAREQDNLRAALRRCLTTGDAAAGLRLGAALWSLWYTLGRYSEGRTWLEELLALPNARTPTAARATALSRAGHLIYNQGDFATARSRLDEALATARLVGDQHEVVAALVLLAIIARRQGDTGRSREQLEEALALSRRLGYAFWTAQTLTQMGALAVAESDYQAATSQLTEALALWRAQHHAWGTARALVLLGRVAAIQGAFEAAETHLVEALRLAREVGDRQGLVRALLALAERRLDAGNTGPVGALLAEALAIAREAGDRLGLMGCLEAIAALVAAEQPEPALRLAAAATELRRALGMDQLPSERARQARWQAVARRRLGAPTVASAAGPPPSTDQAVSEALALAEAAAAGASGSMAAARMDPLTPREREVAVLLARALTNRQIAEALAIREGTARIHAEHVLGKLGLRSRVQVAAWVREHGLLTEPEA
ncbi:MAG: tetratricopeptide repeat protein [Chloroflexi bacterium]|nr:tetratricopeptide repeat protein [Chloroflexota bacterium]